MQRPTSFSQGRGIVVVPPAPMYNKVPVFTGNLQIREFLVTAWLLFLVWMGSSPLLSEPQPLAPEGAEVVADTLVFKNPQYALRLKPLDPDQFRAWLLSKGTPAKLLDDPHLAKLLGSCAVFSLTLENEGPDHLAFNPDQAMLRDREKLVAFQLSMNDLRRSPYGYSDPDLERLSTLFVQESFELGPGQKLERLIAFRPLGGKFPGKVIFNLNKYYYGIVAHQLQCRFKVRYRR